MDDCCNAKEAELRNLPLRQKKVLKVVLVINLAMFFIEGGYSFFAHSTALFADSLDMLGDAFVYGISLYAIGRSIKWNASISFIKGTIMAAFGIGVFVQAAYRFLSPTIPVAETMGLIAGLAFVANFLCAYLLLRHRNDDINMRSTWLCSRNDVLANIGVMAAALAVWLSKSKYPDLVVGIAIAALVLRSAFHVLNESIRSLRHQAE